MKITVVDLETTGVTAADKVVEIATCDLVDDDVLLPWAVLVDPGIPIPPEISAIHHIIDGDVRGALPWSTALNLALAKAEPILAAHQSKFERMWLTDDAIGAGRSWICTYKGAIRIWPQAPSHSNQALRYWLKPKGLDREVASVAHRAGPDAYVTAFILRELLKYVTVEQLIEWSAEPALLPRITFGKHRGLAWAEAPRDYLQWVSKQDGMSEDAIHTAKHHLKESYIREAVAKKGGA